MHEAIDTQHYSPALVRGSDQWSGGASQVLARIGLTAP